MYFDAPNAEIQRDWELDAPVMSCCSCGRLISSDAVDCVCGWEDEEWIAYVNANLQAWEDRDVDA